MGVIAQGALLLPNISKDLRRMPHWSMWCLSSTSTESHSGEIGSVEIPMLWMSGEKIMSLRHRFQMHSLLIYQGWFPLDQALPQH
ncbi:hypothetical protein NPIL_452181 [Nephila pilipes]|uniref:Uncharacterized protein n=1 Tax=Nephila pilipes TaxID=299642 RepID=A0A8X6UG36_NEPPI|nr:hypothetical protein NPIL_452181 [Nephila pilipes]